MKRRTFLQISTSAALSAVAAPGILRAAPAKSPMTRIGMTTVIFRARFAQTRIKDHPPVAELKLAEVPAYFADRFKVHNLEFWSRHFESLKPSYLGELKKKIAATKSRLINIQIDQPYNLANADEKARQESVAFVKTWVDAAVALGSAAVRANTGQGSLEACIKSFREIENYARERRVLLLVENHGGLGGDPDKLLALVNAVGREKLDVLPDFGNFDAPIRYEGLKKILPFARHLISAKTHPFATDGQHPEFDFDRCVQMAQAAGFPGTYSAEYYDRQGKPADYEKITDWMIARLRANLGTP